MFFITINLFRWRSPNNPELSKAEDLRLRTAYEYPGDHLQL
ncbi:MAG: hypothetical protein VKL42_01155 [Snowella sp.]|nr:hypothetical protein [Snowella sp.]